MFYHLNLVFTLTFAYHYEEAIYVWEIYIQYEITSDELVFLYSFHRFCCLVVPYIRMPTNLTELPAFVANRLNTNRQTPGHFMLSGYYRWQETQVLRMPWTSSVQKQVSVAQPVSTLKKHPASHIGLFSRRSPFSSIRSTRRSVATLKAPLGR